MHVVMMIVIKDCEHLVAVCSELRRKLGWELVVAAGSPPPFKVNTTLLHCTAQSNGAMVNKGHEIQG